jgi:hypothetical protein
VEADDLGRVHVTSLRPVTIGDTVRCELLMADKAMCLGGAHPVTVAVVAVRSLAGSEPTASGPKGVDLGEGAEGAWRHRLGPPPELDVLAISALGVTSPRLVVKSREGVIAWPVRSRPIRRAEW